MGIRAVVLSLCLVLGSVLIARASRTEVPPPHESLATFPLQIDAWKGQDAPRFDQQVLNELRVDEYVNRLYYADAAAAGVGFYIGYYETQRQGQTMHSPLNCLPGAGWEPVRRESLILSVAQADTGSKGVESGRTVTVNRLTIQKGLEKQVVLYWYQSHGRVVASEYLGRIYTVVDAIRLNRTDGAMIRIIAPVLGSEAAAERTAVEFAEAMFPLLQRYLPN